MSANSNVVRNSQLVEYGKFVELQNDSRFPPISVTRWDYRDSGTALSSVDVYPKYAVLSYLTNADDIKISLSAENINVNLQDVENMLNVISPNVADIKTNTNDIEVLLDRTNTLLNTLTSNTDQLEVNTDGVETLLIQTNTLLNTLTSRIGGEGPGGAFTQCETKTSGNPSFTPAQIYIHNTTNAAKNVELTLISGMSCIIAMGQQNSPNHALTLNLAVSGVTDYGDCSITYFA